MKRSIWPLITALIFELFLLLVFGIVVFITFGYASSNAIVWNDFALLRYSSGMESVWLFLVVFSQALQYLIFIYLAIEAMLYMIRSAGKAVIKGYEKFQGVEATKWRSRINKISTLGLYKAIKINTPKRGIITYVIVVALMFLTGLVGNAVLKNQDSLVYRTMKTINLYSEEEIVDFTPSINEEDVFDIIIHAGMANIHLYQIKQTSQAKFYLLYDEVQIKDQYLFDIDLDTKTITASVNLTQANYEKYVDPVIPSLEFYLPEWLKLGTITLVLEYGGIIRLDYIHFQNLDLQANHSEIHVRNQTEFLANTITLEAHHSKVTLQIDRVKELQLTLNHTYFSGRLRVIDETLAINAWNHAEVLMFQSTIANLEIQMWDSSLQLIETYPKTALIEVFRSQVYFSNGQSQYPYESILILPYDSNLQIRGVLYDTTRDGN